MLESVPPTTGHVQHSKPVASLLLSLQASISSSVGASVSASLTASPTLPASGSASPGASTSAAATGSASPGASTSAAATGSASPGASTSAAATGSASTGSSTSATATSSASTGSSTSSTATASPTRSASGSVSTGFTPSATATPLPSGSLTDLYPVTILSNLGAVSPGVPIAAGPLRRRLFQPVASPTHNASHVCNNTGPPSDKFGGVALTDQQRVAITFTSPCPAPPCMFTLTNLTLCLKALPAYFLSPDAVATVSFKVELGRYYTNNPVRRQLDGEEAGKQRGGAAEGSGRQLHSSPAPNFAPYVDIQTTVWTPKIYVGPNVTCFTVPLTGLHYNLWALSSLVTPGDIKLIITPYIHYDRSHASVPQSVLDCTPEQIEWVLGSCINNTVPVSYFDRATGFLMPPGCPQNVNGQLVSTRRLSASGDAQEESAAHARRLTNWFPDVCISQDPWDCLGFYPGFTLRGEIPSFLVFGNPQVRSDTFADRLSNPGLGLVPVRRQLHSVPTYNAVDCPAPYTPSSSGAPFVGADDISYGRWLSGHSIATRYLLNTTGAFEILLLFPAPCTRCNLFLRELWLPLKSDCGSDLTVTATVGYWSNNFTIPDEGTDKVYPGSYFTSSGHPNGASTLIHLSSVLTSVSVILGDGWSDAKLEIPFTGGLQWIGVRLRADKCFKLGEGLNLDDFTPACANVTVTPTGLLRALRIGANTVWDAVDETPGAFLPGAHVEPWIPFCAPYPSPSYGASPSNAPTPTRTPSGSSTFSVGPLYRTGEIVQPGFTSPAPNAWSAGGAGSDGSSHSVSGMSAGAIAGIVIGCVVGAVALALLAAFVVQRQHAARTAGPARGAASAAAGSVSRPAGASAAAGQAASTSGRGSTAPTAPATAAGVAASTSAAGSGTSAASVAAAGTGRIAAAAPMTSP